MELNRQNCNVLKGMAIICIFLHNYCHLLPGAPEENEYSWAIDKTCAFIWSLPDSPFISLFSFLGHYGVAVFVFLSGYGLVKKYGMMENDKIRSYLINHFLKLFKLMFPGFVFYYTLHWILYGDYDGMNLLRFVSQMFFINNLIPTKISPIIPGPYWYFGLTMQLYLLFLLLNKFSSIKRWIFISCCVFALLLSKDHHYMNVWLKYNFVGSIMPFVIGAYMAKGQLLLGLNQNKVLCGIISIVSFSIFLISELNYYTWIFASVFVLCFSICIAKLFSSLFNTLFSSVGRVSHFIFVIHPIVRTFVFYLQDKYILEWQFGIVIYVALTLSLSFLASFFSAYGLKMIRL